MTDPQNRALQEIKAEYEEHKTRLIESRRRQRQASRRQALTYAAVMVPLMVAMFVGPDWLQRLVQILLVVWLLVLAWRLRPGRCHVCGRRSVVAVPKDGSTMLITSRWNMLWPATNHRSDREFICMDHFMDETRRVLGISESVAD
jgi:hypothetical protein